MTFPDFFNSPTFWGEGAENARLENVAPYCKGGNRRTGKRRNDKVWKAKRNLTHASRWCHVATSISVSRALTKCSVRDVVVPSAVLELTWYCDFTNVQLFSFFWTVLLICRTMEIAFCLCTVIFIFHMDHASLVFRRCMCILIVFLSRVSTLTRDIDIAIPSVRPSVCP